MPRTVVWFSAGAASAVAAKLTLADTPDAVIAYTDPGSEHPDNVRFLDDCERWFGKQILRLKSEKYNDTWEVWEATKFIVSPMGAPCTAEMKKKVRRKFQLPDDIQVFGYTAEEQARADRFREQNIEVNLRTPLIERGLTKSDCLAIVDRAGIQIPAMYMLGYQNNNCIGCPKGGIGYWNKIRKDFPDVFQRMAELERRVGASCLHDKDGPIWLDELDPNRGSHRNEPNFECSLLCVVAEDDMNGVLWRT